MAKTTITSPALISLDVLRRTADDLTTLNTMLGWLSAMLGSIADATEIEGSNLESRLLRVRDLAGAARYLTSDCEGMAEVLADATWKELNEQTEAGHGK